MKARELSVGAADHLMIEALRRDVLPASQLPQIIQCVPSAALRRTPSRILGTRFDT
jgi:hypothetical protein